MNLRTIDLNLLVVLDALLAEHHVTRAGARLGLSQPATSNALDRLRQLFGDPLFERVPSGLAPTPRAEMLRQPLAEALRGVAAVVGAPKTDVAAIEQTIRLSSVDYGVAYLVGPLLAKLARRAPGISIVCHQWTGAVEEAAAIEAGSLDLAISIAVPGDLRTRPLMYERYVVAMRSRHPAAGKLTLARWLAYPHVVVSGRGSATGPLDAVLAERGKARRVGVVVPSFLSVPPLLATSDLIGLLPETVARRARDIAWSPPPIAVPGFEVVLTWHSRRDSDPANVVVRDELVRLATAAKPRLAAPMEARGHPRRSS